MCARGMPRSRALDAPQQPSADRPPVSASQGVPSPERVLLPADGPPRARLDGRDRQREVLAVQRVPGLGAQRVPCAEPGRQAAEGRRPRTPARPTAPASAPTTGSARSRARRCTRCGTPAPARRRSVASTIGHVVEVGRQAQRAEHVGRARALHREHAERPVLVGSPAPTHGAAVGQPAHHLGGVRGVRHEEHLVLARPGRRSGRRPRRRTGRSTACTAPCPARCGRGRWSGRS